MHEGAFLPTLLCNTTIPLFAMAENVKRELGIISYDSLFTLFYIPIDKGVHLWSTTTCLQRSSTKEFPLRPHTALYPCPSTSILPGPPSPSLWSSPAKNLHPPSDSLWSAWVNWILDASQTIGPQACGKTTNESASKAANQHWPKTSNPANQRGPSSANEHCPKTASKTSSYKQRLRETSNKKPANTLHQSFGAKTPNLIPNCNTSGNTIAPELRRTARGTLAPGNVR